ncbi:hypothetical protein ACVIGB_000768 [Bradyrhizobium sp. USDA 4341]
MSKKPKTSRPKPLSAAMKVSFVPLKDGVEIVPYVVSGIAAGAGEGRMTSDRMIEVLGDVIREAREETAKRLSFRRRKPLKAEDLTIAAVDLDPQSIGLPADAPPIRYKCNGIHPDDGGGWTDWASGLNEEEAQFHALWMMALNGEDYPPTDPDDLDGFIGAMQDSEIDYIAPDPVTKEELAEAAARLLVEVGASSGSAYDEVREMLDKLDIKVGDRALRM